VTVTPIVEVGTPVSATPGQPAFVEVRVVNAAEQPRGMLVTIVGLDVEWTPLPVQTPPLPAGGEWVGTMTVTPQAGCPVGTYGYVVAAQPLDPTAETAIDGLGQAYGEISVGDPSQLSVEISPREPAAVRTRRISVNLTNRGAEPMSVELKTTASSGLDFAVRRTRTELPPGGTQKIPARVSAHRGRLVGAPRRLPFVLTAFGQTTPVRVDGVFVAHPVLNRGVTKALALIAVLAVWASAGLLALNAINRHAQKNNAATVALPAGSGGNGTGSGSGGGQGGANGKGGVKITPAKSSTTRLNGTVTGTAPGHVKVTIRPTSLVDENTAGAQSVNVADTTSLNGTPGKLSAAVVDLGRPNTDAVIRSTTTTKDGAFAFAGVKAPAFYLVTLSKPGFQIRKLIVQATPGQPLPTLTVPMAAGTGSMAGVIRGPAAKALGGAHVTLTDGSITVSTNTPTTGKVGHWSVEGLTSPATYLVTASDDGYATASALVTVKASGSAVQNITLKPGVESLVGMVKDPNNNGFGGATITATSGDVTRSVTTATSGSVGAYILPNLPVGTYTVKVQADGFSTQTLQAKIDGGASSLTKDVQLTSSTATISGTILAAGLTGPAAVVGSAGLILSGDAGTYKTTSLTQTGGFTLTGVAPGDYVLTVEAFGFITNFVKVTAHAGDDLTLPEIDLTQDPTGGVPSTSTISGHVVDAHTGAAPICPPLIKSSHPAQCQVTVQITPPEGSDPLDDVSVAPDQPYLIPSKTESHPAYAKGLPPGLYKLTFHFPGYEPSTLAVAVAESSAVNAVPIALTPNGAIIGHLTSTATDLNGCVLAVPFDPKNPTVVQPLPTGTTCSTQPSAAAATAEIPPTCAADPKVCIGVIDPISRDYAINFVPQGTYWVYVRPETAGGGGVLTGTPDSRFVTIPPIQLTVEAGQDRRYDTAIDQLAAVDVLIQKPSANGSAANAGNDIPVTLSRCTGPATCTSFVSSTKTGTSHAVNDATTAQDLISTSGVAEFRNVPAGTYVVDGGDGNPFHGTSPPFQVGVNITVTEPLVITKLSSSVVGQVYTLVDNQPQYVSGATVSVGAITGYNGSTPVHSTFNVTTNTKGCFAIQSGGTAVNIPTACGTGGGTFAGNFVASTTLVLPPDSVTVTADQYGTQTFNGLAFTDVTNPTGIVLTPPVTPVTGNVTTAPDASHSGQIQLDVAQKAPGAGNISLSVSASGAVSWRDSSLSVSQQNNNDAVPGTYSLRASLSGYDTKTITVNVPLNDDGTKAATFTDTIEQLGTLSVGAYTSCATTAVAVPGATFTLSSASTPAITVAATGTSNTVDFPGLSPSQTYSVLVAAAGYKFNTVSLSVTAGATASNPAPLADQVCLVTDGSITGTVNGQIGTQSAPIAGAKVTATNGNKTFSAITDGLGHYTITGTSIDEGLAAGDWSVTATAFGYQDPAAPSTATVPDGGSVAQPITLVAKPISSITITVLDELGAKVGGASVTLQGGNLTGPDTHTTTSTVPATFSTADTLVVPTGGLTPTTYAVFVTGAGLAPVSTSISLKVGVDPQNFFVSLARASNTISGNVVGVNLDGTNKTNWNNDNVTVSLDRPADNTFTAPADQILAQDNSFNFTGLDDSPSGKPYELTISDTKGDYIKTTRDISIAGGQLASLEIDLRQTTPFTHAVTVEVTSATGDSMSGSLVALYDSSGLVQGPQPAFPTGSGGEADALFNQVPGLGSTHAYTVKVTGVNGHLSQSFTTDSAPPHDAFTLSDTDNSNQSWSVKVAEARLDLKVATATPAAADPGSAHAAVDGASYPVAVNGQATPVYVSAAAHTLGPATLDSDAGSYTLTSNPKGTVTSTVSVTPASGDTTTETWTFTKSAAPPAATASLAVTVQDLSGNPVTPTSVSVSDGTTTTACTLTSGKWNATGLTVGVPYTITVHRDQVTGPPLLPATNDTETVTLAAGANPITVTVSNR
jgi:large repetitive protein